MVVGYCLTVWLRLVTSVVRVAIVIRWLPVIAAAPNFTGLHPVTRSPAPSTTADTLTSLGSTGMSLLSYSRPPRYITSAESEVSQRCWP